MANNVLTNEEIEIHKKTFYDEIATKHLKSHLFSDEDYHYYINTIDNWSTIPGKKEPIQYVIHRQFNYVEIDGEKILYKISENEFFTEKIDDKVIKTLNITKLCKVIKRSDLFDQLFSYHVEVIGHGSARLLYNTIKAFYSNVTRDVCELFVKLCPCQVNKKLLKAKPFSQQVSNMNQSQSESFLVNSKKENRCKGCKEFGHSYKKCPLRLSLDHDLIGHLSYDNDNEFNSKRFKSIQGADDDSDSDNEASMGLSNSSNNIVNNLNENVFNMVDYRFQGMHLPRCHQMKENGSLIEGICQYPGCGRNVTVECMTCHVFLCIGDEFEFNCFAKYHTRE